MRKTLKGIGGLVLIDVPRDLDGSFEPELIRKGQIQIDGMDDKIIGLYAAGLSTRDIRARLVGCRVGVCAARMACNESWAATPSFGSNAYR